MTSGRRDGFTGCTTSSKTVMVEPELNGADGRID
jgi:hypothetical protein